MRSRLPAALVLVIVFGLAGLHGSASAQNSAAGTETAGSGQPLYNAEDLLFLRHMSLHHEQAVVMSELVPERTDRDEFVRFARYVKRAQNAEIEAMEALLDLAAERGLEVPPHAPHGDPPMAGMLSEAEMEALRASTGAEFERRWLEGMIFHHEGGLAMSRAQQLQQLAFGRRPYGFHVLVEDILVEQRAEITKMNGWLEDWGLLEDGGRADERPPAAAVTSPAPGASVAAGASLQLIGTAIDDVDVAGVAVAIRDLDTGEWWQGGADWGERAQHAAELARSGPSSTAWRFDWTPPAPGRYGIGLRARDTSGKTAMSMRQRELDVR